MNTNSTDFAQLVTGLLTDFLPLQRNRSRLQISRCRALTVPEIHAHGFRHSKAMHMLEAGINIVYIRDFLGHEDISTTMVYIRVDNRLKTEAVNKLAPKVTGETEFHDWTKDTGLMSFLNSFK